LSPQKALDYYRTIAPLYTAINSISTESGSLNIVSYNKMSGEAEENNQLLDLLSFPNADCTQYEFMVQLVNFYKLTGNVFIIATGPVNRPALELTVVNPVNILLELGSDGYLEYIKVVGSHQQSTTFKRFDVDGRFRYYSDDAEIWHIKSFNTRYGAGDPWGFSELSPIVMELEQYYEASNHNLSLLKRGARPSGAMKTGETLTDDQYQRVQQQLDQFYSGANNAGRVMLIESGDFIEMSQSNKDMDFAALKTDITTTIYNSLKIPLPIVSADHSSYSNMETAKLNFYDNCVLPATRRILEELTTFLMPRYDKTSNLELRVDLDSIEALEPRRNQELLKLKDSGVLTINEMRAKLKYEPLDGGDELYIPSNLMPVGMDTTDALLKNIDDILTVNELKGCTHKHK
jgi:HK97 family phage portal protein